MQQTQADQRAAREGFKYVVIRHGQRIAYTTTLAEAKRECGKSGKVVSISGMRYAAKNPHGSLNVRNPAKVPKSGWALIRKQGMKDVVVSTHKTKEGAESAMVKKGGIPDSLFTNGYTIMAFGPQTSYEIVSSEYTGTFLRPKRNPSSGAKQRARGTRSFKRGLDFDDSVIALDRAAFARQQLADARKSGGYNSGWEKFLLQGHARDLEDSRRHRPLRNPAKQQWYLVHKYGDYIIGVGKFSSREAARKKANNMVARDVELTGMLLASHSDLEKSGYFDTPMYNNPSKRRNPVRTHAFLCYKSAHGRPTVVERRADILTPADAKREAAKLCHLFGYKRAEWAGPSSR